MKKSLMIGLLASFLMLSFASIALAQIVTPTPIIPPTVDTLERLTGVIDRVVNVLFTILLIGAVIFIIMAAFQFLTGGGDAEQLTQARSKIIWAGVAIIIALVAKGLPTVLRTLIGPTG